MKLPNLLAEKAAGYLAPMGPAFNLHEVAKDAAPIHIVTSRQYLGFRRKKEVRDFIDGQRLPRS